MSPEVRGRGLGQKFLLQCVEAYLDFNNYDLFKIIESENNKLYAKYIKDKNAKTLF